MNREDEIVRLKKVKTWFAFKEIILNKTSENILEVVSEIAKANA